MSVETEALAIATAASEAINKFGDTVVYKKYDALSTSIDDLYEEVALSWGATDTNFKGRITFNPNKDYLSEIGLAQEETNVIVFTTQKILDDATISVDTKDRFSYDGKVYNITQAVKGAQYGAAFITINIAGKELDSIS